MIESHSVPLVRENWLLLSWAMTLLSFWFFLLTTRDRQLKWSRCLVGVWGRKEHGFWKGCVCICVCGGEGVRGSWVLLMTETATFHWNLLPFWANVFLSVLENRVRALPCSCRKRRASWRKPTLQWNEPEKKKVSERTKTGSLNIYTYIYVFICFSAP